MGCCFGKGTDEARVQLTGETDANTSVCCKPGAQGPSINITHDSATDSYIISGEGTMVGSCSLDCDTATWEIKMGSNPGKIRVGIKRMPKKGDHRLNGHLDDKHEGPEDSWYLEGYEAKEGDVIGVYWDQTDKPMLFFAVNGKQIDVGAVNRVKPANDVHPAVSIGSGSTCTVVFNETHFIHQPVYRRFGQIICATSLI